MKIRGAQFVRYAFWACLTTTTFTIEAFDISTFKDVLQDYEEDEVTTLKDVEYEAANFVEVREFPFSDEEQEGRRYFIPEREFKWLFAYRGGESAQDQKRDDIKRAIVWPVKIIGRITGDKYTDNSCGGAQVHPRIVMTLCACVLSYSASYVGYTPETWIPERFKASRLSDPEFDIRAPHLVATRASWEGYITLSGEDPLTAEVSKKIFPARSCSRAWDARYGYKYVDSGRFLQYRSPALLLLNSDFSHPADVFNDLHPSVVEPIPFGALPPYTDYAGRDQPIDHWRRRPTWNLQLAAYDQKQCNKKDTGYMEVRGLTRLIAPYGRQSLVTKWTESNIRGRGLSGLDDREEEMNTCNFTELFNVYAEAKRRILRPDSFNDHPSLDDALLVGFAKNVTYYMEAYLNKSYVACLTWVWGSLCDAPPGSPIMYDHHGVNYLYGLSITRPSSNGTSASGAVRMFALTLAPESPQSDLIRSEIKQLILEIEPPVAATTTERNDNGEAGDEDDRILMRVGGNLDPALIADMQRIFLANQFYPPEVAATFNRCSGPNFPLVALSSAIFLGWVLPQGNLLKCFQLQSYT